MDTKLFKSKLKEHCYSLREFAKVIHVNPSTVYRWMDDKGSPDAYQIYAISKVLKMNIKSTVMMFVFTI